MRAGQQNGRGGELGALMGGYGGEESFQAGYGHAYATPAGEQEVAGREMPVAGRARVGAYTRPLISST